MGSAGSLYRMIPTMIEPAAPMPVHTAYAVPNGSERNASAINPKLSARAKCYRLDPKRDWMPDLDHLRSLVTPATRALVVIDPNNPTGAVYSVETRRALIDFAEQHGLLILADEVYGDLGFDGPVDPYGRLDPDAERGYRSPTAIRGECARYGFDDRVELQQARQVVASEQELLAPGPKRPFAIPALETLLEAGADILP